MLIINKFPHFTINPECIDFTVNLIMNPYLFPITDKDGTKMWFDKDRKLHRENGPAVICKDGREECWEHGISEFDIILSKAF